MHTKETTDCGRPDISDCAHWNTGISDPSIFHEEAQKRIDDADRQRDAALLRASIAVMEKWRDRGNATSDAMIAALVRQKLTSGNAIPAERCTIFAHEIASIDATIAP